MPALDERAGLFRCASLRDAPRRYAVISTPSRDQRLDQHCTHENDVEDLLRNDGMLPARRRGRSFCPFHRHDQASLQVHAAYRRGSIHCSINLSDYPLARHGRNDAYNMYGIGAGLDFQVGLRPLNKRGKPYYAPAMCRRVLVTTPPAKAGGFSVQPATHRPPSPKAVPPPLRYSGRRSRLDRQHTRTKGRYAF